MTDADKSAEDAIRALLHAHRPDDGIVGEEFGDEGLERAVIGLLIPLMAQRIFSAESLLGQR